MNHRSIVFLLVAAALLLLPACEARRVTDTCPLPQEKSEYILAVVLDMSGSFAELMQSGDPIAYRFFVRATEKFFRDRLGSDDKLLIAQLSADQKTLLWEGAPGSLRRKFPDAQAFREFLAARSNPGGSRVYSATADTLDYLMDLPGVADDDTHLLVLVLSDMRSEMAEDPIESKARLQASLKRFSGFKGAIGFYWVDQEFVPDLREQLKESAIRHYAVQADIVDDPALPQFE